MSDSKHDNGRSSDTKKTSSREPIAIVGIGCRFPGGADDPRSYWDMLRNSVNAITEVPEDRWNIMSFYDPEPGKQGKTYTRWGGFIKDIDQFDAAFFGISPREAALMDPQQRLLLEVGWEALEDGGQAVEDLAGTNTGVFVGISTHDYGDIHVKDIYTGNSYTNSGGALSIAANRVSYSFDLRGPSMAVDTACSSSLVAVHLACRSIWDGESSMALAGGVNCILTPEPTVGFSKANMLSPDGQCKAFDASANGYVRSEGAGMVLLKPLSKAKADGDTVYAVILATGVNQDGHTHGLTVPSEEAQAQLLRDVYGQAGIAPERVLYLEAHGTGTPVGDPIETSAIGSVLGAGRAKNNALRIGSVKTNVGHLEAASGMAGLIKAALVVKHRELVPNRNFNEPNPRIAFDELRLRVQQKLEKWPKSGDVSVVGVNSFGFGGTNAHVVLDEAPPELARREETTAKAPQRSYLLPISARNGDALKALAQGYIDIAEKNSDAVLADLTFTAATRRSHNEQRLAVTAGSLADLAENLRAFINGETRPGMSSGRASARPPRLAFVFSGMGPQWWGMGRQLLENEPVFREAVEACDALFKQHANWSLIDELSADATTSRLDQTEYAQPANFALQVGLAALWRHWGIEPEAIVGHSAGEVAAAYEAGILSLEDAVTVIYHRSRLQQRASGTGKMLAAGISAAEAVDELGEYHDRVSLAALNSPKAVTLSGDADAIEAIARSLDSRRIFARVMDVAVPYHSHHMDPLKDDLLECLSGIKPQAASVPYYSVVTGGLISGTEIDADYWWRNVRQPVEFAQAVDKMLQDGFEAFVELAPHPVLARSVLEVQTERGAKATVVPSLRREGDDRALMLGSLGTLYTLGTRIDWPRVNPGAISKVSLPAYPWQRERHWDESDISSIFRLARPPHALLERRIDSARPAWETRLDSSRLSYISDHKIQGAVVFPAAAYLEMALAAGRELLGEGPTLLEDVEFKRALTIQQDDSSAVQISLEPADGSFMINSHARGSQSWALHATGRVVRDRIRQAPKALNVANLQKRSLSQVEGAETYVSLAERGLQYGPQFQGIENLWLGNREALGRISLKAEPASDAGPYRLHPSLLDACFQVLIGAVLMDKSSSVRSATYIPVKIERLRWLKALPAAAIWSQARLTKQGNGILEGDFTLQDDEGEIIAEITGLRCQALPDARTGAATDLSDYLFDLQWLPRVLTAGAAPREAAYLPNPDRIWAALSPQAAEPDESRALIEKLSSEYALQALQSLGWAPVKGEKVLPELLAMELGVATESVGVLAALLESLRRDGLLKASSSGYTLSKTLPTIDPQKTWSAALEANPENEGTLNLLDRAAVLLPAVLRGERDVAQHFADGSLPELVSFFAGSTIFEAQRSGLTEAVRSVAASLPSKKTLRVLEIAGGTGARASALLPLLPRNATEYVFTDPSSELLSLSRQVLAGQVLVDYRTLDIEKGIEAQGLTPHSFDLIIAGRLSGAGIENARRLLASQGLVIASTQEVDSGAFELAQGLLGSWWRPESAAQADETAWRGAGFENVAAVDGLLLARGPAEVETVAPPATPALASGSWLIFADSAGVGEQLADDLEAQGESTVLVSSAGDFQRIDARHYEVRADSPEDMVDLLSEITAGQPSLRGVVHLWSLDAPPAETARQPELEAALVYGSLSVLNLIHAFAKAGAAAPSRLWLVTRGAQAVGDEAMTGLMQAPLWGMGRVAMNEHPHLRCSLIDLDPDAPEVETGALLRELTADDIEQEVALRGENRYVARVVRQPRESGETTKGNAIKTQVPFQMEVARPGSLESLVLREKRRKRPAAGEVEIEVFAAGLNFRDVMKTMGLYPSEEGDPFWLGDECSGRVARVGAGVTNLKEGDEVIAVAPGCFASFVTVPAQFVVKKPAHISFEEAAAIPIVFLTTHYAFNHLARISAEDRILIHSAAGGVGLSAIQLAKLADAEIFATAGSPEKRSLLKSLGIKHVMDSRSLDFADETMRITGGKGISVVLNSLAGDFIPKSISLLEPTGRFLELGKVDLYQNSKLGLWPFRSGLSFFAIDMGWLLQHRPELSRQLLEELMAMFEDKRLEPLPVQSFPISEASKAFRFMAQAGHTGKIVLNLKDQAALNIEPAPVKKRLFRADGTYLITGGLGGFGLAVARWMVQEGARNLMLVGRSGVSSPEAAQAVEELREAGARVEVGKADAGREHDITQLITEVGSSMPPLRGVFHAAMVLDDSYLLQLTESRFQRVMGPKADGAWNLHIATLDEPLDYFVMFSSLASWAGSVGQGNYSAANAFLDSLAHYRKVKQLPALTVNWGALAEVGYVARNPEIGRHLDRQGFLGLNPGEATSLLGRLLQAPEAEAGAIRVDFASMASTFSAGAAQRRFSSLLQQTHAAGTSSASGAKRGELLERLRGLTAEEQTQRLEQMLRREVSSVLGIPAARLDPEQDLSSLGLDSLMSVELEIALETELGADLPLGFFLGEEISLRNLSRRLQEQVAVWLDSDEAAVPGAEPVSAEESEVIAAGGG